MSSRELLFQWASTIKIKLSELVYYKADIIVPNIIWKGVFDLYYLKLIKSQNEIVSNLLKVVFDL